MRSRTLALLLAMLLLSAGLHAQQEADDSTVTYTPSDTTIVQVDTTSPPDATGVDEPAYQMDRPQPIGAPEAGDAEPVAVRPLPRAQMEKARSEDDFWYWNYRKKPKVLRHEDPPPSGDYQPMKIPQGLFWVFIAIGILTLLYLLLRSMGVGITRKPVVLAQDGEPESEEDFFSRDFERGVRRALEAGDYRLAIRLRYLQVLRELADRNIIQYRQGATNGVYVSQLLGTNYYSDFFRITRTFEYAWYGMLPVTQLAYDRMQQDVAHLKNRFA